MSLESLDGGGRGRLAPQLVDQQIRRDDLIRVEEQNREQSALLRTADLDRSTVVGHFEWAEDPVLHSNPFWWLLVALQPAVADSQPNRNRPATGSAPMSDELGPNWRADGPRIAFMSNRVTARNPEGDFELFVMNANGSHAVRLTSNAVDDEDPAWSPDGGRIVFQRDFNPIDGEVDLDLYTMRADGTGERNLTSSPGVQDREPNWTANGKSIAFVSDRDGDFEVFTLRPDGSNVRQLTFNDAQEFRPNWSPDSRIVGFASDQVNVSANPAFDYEPDWQPLGSARRGAPTTWASKM